MTLVEARRRRLVLTVFLLTALMIVFTAYGFSRLNTLHCGRDGTPCSPTEIQLAASLLLILVAYMFDSVIVVGASFVAAPSIAGEIETGILLAILPRPIRRRDVILGKWLGLVVLVAIYAVFTYALEFLAVRLVVGYAPPHPIEAVLYVIGEAIVLMTLALLVSTRLAPMTGGIIAVVLFGVAWMAGIAEAIGIAFENTVLTNVGVIVGLAIPTDALWRNAIYNLEPIAMIVAQGSERILSANPFFVASPPPIANVIWAATWVVVVLGLAVYSFEKRDL
jgi:ABC-type transport system involved in multi-copper enzyme maturation permease subunit